MKNPEMAFVLMMVHSGHRLIYAKSVTLESKEESEASRDAVTGLPSFVGDFHFTSVSVGACFIKMTIFYCTLICSDQP